MSVPSQTRITETASADRQLPIGATPPLIDPDLEVLLGEPFARAYAQRPPGGDGPCGLRERLQQRLQATGAAEASMVTVRLRRQAGLDLAPGVVERTLYVAPGDRELRPGEPLRVRIFDLAAGTGLDPRRLGDPDSLAARHAEWLVMTGTVAADGMVLTERDYHVVPAGRPWPRWTARTTARLFLRESRAPAADAATTAFTVRDAEAGWPDFAPGVQRRVLWHGGGQAALLYFAQPGALVPNHVHGHDEECLMVQGELFLDDLLLQPGDYQLAPAGTGHRITQTDVGTVIYAHGDLDLQFR